MTESKPLGGEAIRKLFVEVPASLDDEVIGHDPVEVDHAWGLEMVRRSQQVASGEVKTLAWSAVLERVAVNRRSR